MRLITTISAEGVQQTIGIKIEGNKRTGIADHANEIKSSFDHARLVYQNAIIQYGRENGMFFPIKPRPPKPVIQ